MRAADGLTERERKLNGFLCGLVAKIIDTLKPDGNVPEWDAVWAETFETERLMRSHLLGVVGSESAGPAVATPDDNAGTRNDAATETRPGATSPVTAAATAGRAVGDVPRASTEALRKREAYMRGFEDGIEFYGTMQDGDRRWAENEARTRFPDS